MKVDYELQTYFTASFKADKKKYTEISMVSLYVKNINMKRKVLHVTNKFKMYLKENKIIFGFSQNTTIYF